MTITFRSDLDTAELVREIRYLGKTDNPASIATRLGYSLEGLSARLRRDGYIEESAPFDRERDRSVA